MVIADDHAIVRQGTRQLLEASGWITVVAECHDAPEVLPAVRHLKPDMVLLDINLPTQNGFEVLKQLRERPDTATMPVVFFTAHVERPYVQQARQLGANGYLTKTITAEKLYDYLQQVWQAPFASSIAQPVFSDDILSKLTQWEDNTPQSGLTAREHEILTLVASGLTNKQMAEQLYVSVKTVDNHVAKLMKKLGVNNRSQLTAKAYENGWV